MKQSFRYNLTLCYNSHAYSPFDEYTRQRLLFAANFRYTLFKVFKELANWLKALQACLSLKLFVEPVGVMRLPMYNAPREF